ncbi:hypothetical protein DVH24_003873 [Malus domestica]|uniref:Uncharacterized protein n=1 Tax=Malus domestica TaxID=3750 RepID=A0A498K6P7_MALDO|nr:hypothetical protein DVH24_003873 [Malus domestica]
MPNWIISSRDFITNLNLNFFLSSDYPITIKTNDPIKSYYNRKTNEKCLKTLTFKDKDKINGKVNSTRFDFLV